MLRIDEQRNAQVNDKRGNPIEIAAVIVWRVDDTARASFDVDSCENYVKLQTEAAVRHLASMALRELSDKQVVALDDERKAAMVTNLMTVLCAESEVQPVINTGTLYN